MNPDPEKMPTLRKALSRTQLRVTSFAVAFAAVTVLLAGLTTIAIYARTNLKLIAQTASYSVAPAVVFGDPKGIDASLLPLAATPGVAEITVRDIDGKLLARLRNPHSDKDGPLTRVIEASLLAMPERSQVDQFDRRIGDVYVTGDGQIVASYVTTGIAGAAACLLVTLVASVLLNRRLHERIIGSLRSITEVAHAVRVDRDFDQRAGPASIREIDNLRTDFNALIGELAAWQDHLRDENRELTHKATHDPLTGLPNRASFEETLTRTIAVAERHQQRFVVLIADGNGFKAVNDKYGHAAGDVVLKTVAARLRGALRQTDMAARLGGDEFALLLCPPSHHDNADRVTELIRQSMQEPIVLPSGDAVSISLSIGSASYPDDGASIFALVHHADMRMYATKSATQSLFHEQKD